MIGTMVVGIEEKGGIWSKKGRNWLSKGMGLQSNHVCEYWPRYVVVVQPECGNRDLSYL